MHISDLISFGNRSYALDKDGTLFCFGDFPGKIEGDEKPHKVDLGQGVAGDVTFDELTVGSDFMIGVKATDQNDLVYKLDTKTHMLAPMWQGQVVKLYQKKVLGSCAILKADKCI
eukprot:scaffold1353_cov161-Amphora_coffeaeformis.AAC.6